MELGRKSRRIGDFSLTERLCLQKYSTGQMRKTPDINFYPTHTHMHTLTTHRHTDNIHTETHLHTRTHMHTQRNNFVLLDPHPTTE